MYAASQFNKWSILFYSLPHLCNFFVQLNKKKHIISDHNQCLTISIHPNAVRMSFIRTKQQQSHEILKEKRTFINNTIERRQQGRAARPLHLHIIPNSRVQLKPTLVYKEFYFFFGSRGSVRAQANEIPLGNKRTDCSLDLFVDSAEINFLDTVVNGILLTVS